MPDTATSQELTQLMVLAGRRSSPEVLTQRRHSLCRVCGITRLQPGQDRFPCVHRAPRLPLVRTLKYELHSRPETQPPTLTNWL